MTIGFVGAAGTCWPTSKEAYSSIYTDQGYIYWSNGTTIYQAYKLYFPGANQLFEAINSMTPPATTWSTVRNSTMILPQQGSCTLETSPGYPSTITGSSGGGTVTGTVQLTYPEPNYDYAVASAAWSFGFITVVGIWLVAKHAGAVVNFTKNW